MRGSWLIFVVSAKLNTVSHNTLYTFYHIINKNQYLKSVNLQSLDIDNTTLLNFCHNFVIKRCAGSYFALVHFSVIEYYACKSVLDENFSCNACASSRSRHTADNGTGLAKEKVADNHSSDIRNLLNYRIGLHCDITAELINRNDIRCFVCQADAEINIRFYCKQLS